MLIARLVAALLLLNYLPGLFFVELSSSSMAAGLLVGGVLAAVLLFSPRYLRTFRRGALGRTCFGVLLFVVYVAAIYLSSADTKVLSSFALLLLFLCAYLFSRRLVEMRAREISSALGWFLFITFVLGWLALFDLTNVGTYARHLKAVTPFSEESHYALCVGTFSILYCVVSRGWMRVFILVNVAIQSMLFPSLTLLVFAAMLAGLLLMQSGWRFKLLVAVPIGFLLSFVLYGVLLGSEYFSSRISLSDSENLTAMVWVQGWELAKLNMLSNFGLGLGLQMLGSADTRVPDVSYAFQGMHAEGRMLNMDDGGFLAAKLIAEMGVVGLVLVSRYVFSFYKSFIALNKLRDLEAKYFISLLHGATFALLVEVFLRGYGYFSPGLFIFLVLFLAVRRGRLVSR